MASFCVHRSVGGKKITEDHQRLLEILESLVINFVCECMFGCHGGCCYSVSRVIIR